MTPQSRRVALATGLGYHLLEWPSGSDHTVLLLHGFLDNAHGWTPMVEGLADRFHVVAPDMRGHGDSDRVGAGGYYHFFDYLADLQDLVPRVARGRLSLVGHSMGGSIASYYAGSYPDRVAHLALLEGTGPPVDAMPSGPLRVQTWLASWQRVRAAPPKSYPSAAEAAARLRKHDPLLSPEEALRLVEVGTRPTPDGGLVFKHDPLHATLGPYSYQLDVAERFWRAVRCPVLLVDGGASTFRLAAADAGARHACFADHRQVTLSGAGHMMQRHQPAALAKLLCEFLER